MSNSELVKHLEELYKKHEWTQDTSVLYISGVQDSIVPTLIEKEQSDE